MSSKMHATQVNIPLESRQMVVKMLNTSLAVTTDLHMAFKQAHWNIKGMEFYALHLLFDEIAKEMTDFSDLIAERVTALGGTASGTLQQAANSTQLPPYPTDIFSTKDHLNALINRLGIAANHMREHIRHAERSDDMVTSDMYIGITTGLDKRLWFLQAHLQ